MPDDSQDDISVDDYSTSHSPGLNLFDRLNHSDLAELLTHEHVIPSDVLLRTGVNKIEKYRDRFDRERDQYRSLLALVATSTWHRAREFSLCGLRNARDYSQPCHQWNICPACSYAKRKRTALAAYLTRFHRTSWRLVTISFQAEFSEGILDEMGIQLCWKAASSALHEYQRAGGIRGAMTRSELHLEGFLPTRYFPHLHAVVDAEAVYRETLAEHVFAFRCPDDGQRIMCPVSIHDRVLPNERSFANALSYLGKPL